MARGLLITFEGIDGCGKSTQLKHAEAALRRDGVPVVVTREPGGTAIGEKIRALVMSAEHGEMSVGCEVLLYLASRAQHVAERIMPALEQGAVVLCDRFQDATFAYQGFGRGVSLELLHSVNAFATGGIAPDLSFVFDVSVELSVERLRKSRKAPDRMESNTVAFYQKIREGYLVLASSHPSRIVLLPGERPIDELAAEVYAAIRRRMA
jgi:dTMP kinase